LEGRGLTGRPWLIENRLCPVETRIAPLALSPLPFYPSSCSASFSTSSLETGAPGTA